MPNNRKKIIRITTVPMNLFYPLRGQPSFMQAHGFDVTMICSDGKELPWLLKSETPAHIMVPLTRKITPLQDLKCLFQLVKIIRKIKPDIVHAESPKAGLLGMIAGFICGIKIRIYTNAGLAMLAETNRFRLFLLETIEKIIYLFATNIWPNGPSTIDYILKHKYTKPKKVQLIGNGSSNGIDIDRFNRNNLDPAILEDIKQSIGYNAENIYLLFLGRLVRDKGITELMNVYFKMLPKNPKLKLVLVGSYEKDLDPLPPHIEHEIENNPAIIQFTWTEYPEYFMALADYFVFPTHREGFPNVLLEAGAMKLSVVCSRIMGNTDIIKDGETGYMFERMSEETLQIKLEEAINSPAKAQAMASKLHGEIISKYNRKIFWEVMLGHYNSLLQKRDAAQHAGK